MNALPALLEIAPCVPPPPLNGVFKIRLFDFVNRKPIALRDVYKEADNGASLQKAYIELIDLFGPSKLGILGGITENHVSYVARGVPQNLLKEHFKSLEPVFLKLCGNDKFSPHFSYQDALGMALQSAHRKMMTMVTGTKNVFIDMATGAIKEVQTGKRRYS